MNKTSLFCIIFACSLACNSISTKDKPAEINPAQKDTAAPAYDLLHPRKKWSLPESLNEISGQVLIDSQHILAIEDLHPTLYLLRLGDSVSIEKMTSFKDSTERKFDLEDVTKVGNIVYALWSHGSVYKIKNWDSSPDAEKFKTGLSKENNTEGLCYDPVSHNLLIACKNESDMEDEKKSTRSIFEFDLGADTLKDLPFLLIHKKDFKPFIGQKMEFFPSAIAVHPITHDVYILSTRDNKCMACYSYDGRLQSLQFFDKDLLPQPEGICFAPDGDLYISSEARHGEPASIMRFAWKK